MSVVIATPPFLAFFDLNGNPLAGGLIYTYAAGTTTPMATYTDSTGLIPMSNPIVLDNAGRSTWWLAGSYKYIIKDALGNTIATTDNVTSFNTLADATNAFFQSFSGDGTTTSFTLSSDLGTEEKALMVFVNTGQQALITNGNFATDTIWTKGIGWTIGSGVATATGAISTAISQTALFTLVAGTAYAVSYTITASAGSLTPSIGGNAGTARTVSGTYTEIISAGTTQIIAFTGAAFTGTLDNVSVTVANPAGYDIQNPSAFTVNATNLTFAIAPALGTNNIYVFAPSLLLGAASSAAAAAQAAAAAALTSQTSAFDSATSAAAFAQAKVRWTYSSTITMSNPGVGGIRLNNATIASATAIAIADQSADSGNPDLSAWVNTWDDGSGSNRGTIYIFKDNANFALFSVNSANVDNTTWNQISVTYLSGQGSFANTNTLYIGFAASGTTTVTGGITALTGDVTASGSGSVAATIANNAVTTAKINAGAVTEAKITLIDITTNDVSISAHGFTPKAPNDTSKFLRGDATWASNSNPVKAWVKFDGTSSAAVSGTYSRAGTTITATVTAHGQLAGHKIQVTISTGSGTTGTYVITSVTDANTFVYTESGSGVTSGNLSLPRRTIAASSNIANIPYITTGQYVMNFSSAMTDANYCIVPSTRVLPGTSNINIGYKGATTPTTLYCELAGYEFGSGYADSAYCAPAIIGN